MLSALVALALGVAWMLRRIAPVATETAPVTVAA